MLRINIIRILILMLIITLFAGCIELENTLINAYKFDKELLGQWNCKKNMDDDVNIYLAIHKNKKGYLDVIFSSDYLYDSEDDTTKIGIFEVIPIVIDQQKFMIISNNYEIYKKIKSQLNEVITPKKTPYLLLAYKIEKNILYLYAFNVEKIRGAIEKKELIGKNDKLATELYDTNDKIIDFLKKNKIEIYEKEPIFVFEKK